MLNVNQITVEQILNAAMAKYNETNERILAGFSPEYRKFVIDLSFELTDNPENVVVAFDTDLTINVDEVIKHTIGFCVNEHDVFVSETPNGVFVLHESGEFELFELDDETEEAVAKYIKA